MKQLLSLLVIFTLSFSYAYAQTPGNAVPWDIVYKMAKDETRTIKGEKGKVILVTFLRHKGEKTIAYGPEMILKKTDAITGEKLELEIVLNVSMDNHYIIKEGDELVLRARSEGISYVAGYKYDVQ